MIIAVIRPISLAPGNNTRRTIRNRVVLLEPPRLTGADSQNIQHAGGLVADQVAATGNFIGKNLWNASAVLARQTKKFWAEGDD